MKKINCTVTEILTPSIGSTITAVHEEEHEVFLHLNDGQMIIVHALSDGGFTVNLKPSPLH